MAVQLVVIGGGNMGGAIVRGISSGPSPWIAPESVVVCEADADRRGALAAEGVRTCDDHAEALAVLSDAPGQGYVLLAVKPQALKDVAGQVHGLIPPSCAVISILAGTPIALLAAALGRAGVGGVIRAMPNTAASVRAGITALTFGPGTSAAQRRFAEGLFGAVGRTVEIDESLMDAFTALAGSGPAYVCYLAEAMVRAGEEIGFDRASAERIVGQTLAGAAALLATGRSPESLRAAVTSPGGTTEAAVTVLEERGAMRAIIDAVIRGRDRGRELGRS